MPRSACTALDRSFAQALDNVRQWLWRTLRHDVPGLPLNHLALAWDLHFERPHGALEDGVSNLAGPSAGVVFALAALRALQAAAPPGLAALLARLPMDALFDLWATAALMPDGSLGTVGGTGAKTLALAPLLQALVDSPAGPHAACVHVAKGQQQMAGSLPGAPPLVEHTSITDLLRDLPGRLEPPDPAAERLHRLLLGTDPRPQPADADLRHVAGPMPTPTLARWLLKQWARWALREGGQLHARYVRLVVRPDARGPGQAPVPEASPRELAALLKDFDSTGQHAYVLRGRPGAGKSTLMRHHLMDLSRIALRHLRTGTNSGARPDGSSPVELPLYLPLAQLPANADAAQWVRLQLHAAGAPAEVRTWFSAGARRPAGYCLRLMLDGINELPVRDGQERHERAAEAVSSLRSVLQGAVGGTPTPPMLLSIRQNHADSLAGVDLLRVDVLDWADADMQAYLQLRFPTPPNTPEECAPWKRRWQDLAAQSNGASLALCRVPLNLTGQCDLWEGGYPHPVQYRAALYTAWLWLRLRRALGHGPGLLREAVEAGQERARNWRDLGLLSRRDVLRIADPKAWLNPYPTALPMEGTLLQDLLQQAETQYWDDADTGKSAAQRCTVVLPLRSVASWITDANLHEHWRTAVAEIGLADVDETAGSFGFSHQSWGEFLASVRLLDDTPPSWVAGIPSNGIQRLLRSCPKIQLSAELAKLNSACVAASWPGMGVRTDEEELAHLKANAGIAWQRALPHLKALAVSPLPVNLLALLNDRCASPPGTPLGELLDEFNRNYPRTDSIGEGGSRGISIQSNLRSCYVDLELWGNSTAVAESIGAEANEWADSAAGWQVLVHEILWPPVRQAVWAALARSGVDGDTLGRMQSDSGRIGQPPQGDIDEVLSLAITGLHDPAPWLAWLLAAGHSWRLGPAVAVLASRLEPDDASAEPLPGSPPRPPRPWRGPQSPVLQHWRRLLFLYSIDAGAGLRQRLRRGGWWAVLQRDLHGLPPLLEAHWKHTLKRSFSGLGIDLRLRLQAAEWLGILGDTMRLEWGEGTVRLNDGGIRAVAGLRLSEHLWVSVQTPSGGPKAALSRERLMTFEAAAQPVTVAEWNCFVADGGYDPLAPWWRDAGLAAQSWILTKTRDAGGMPLRSGIANRVGWNSPLQPATCISLFEALAYARWASALQPRSASGSRRLEVPTEMQWQCTAGGPQQKWWKRINLGSRVASSGSQPKGLVFNHAGTRLARPSPVGVFSRGFSTRGVADLVGNVWEWCCNPMPSWYRSNCEHPDEREAAAKPASLDDIISDRALRGGAFSYAARHCSATYRAHGFPGFGNGIVGLRLVATYLPATEIQDQSP